MAKTIIKLESKTKGVRYRAKVNVAGKQVTATFDKKSLAAQWASDTEKELQSAKGYTHFHKRLAELVDAYLQSDITNRQKKTKHLAYWKTRLGKTKLFDLDAPKIAAERDHLLTSKTTKGGVYRPATVVRYMASLSHCCGWGIERGWLKSNPVKGIKRPSEDNKRTRWLTAEEKGALLKACACSANPQLASLVKFALLTGMRQGEIFAARWEYIHGDTLRVPNTKNGEIRLVPITKTLGSVLAAQKAWVQSQTGDTGLIFPKISSSSGQVVDEPIMSIRTAWDSALTKAGIEDFRFHDLRHTAASYISMTGAKGKTLGSLLGHKSPAAADRYQHIAPEHDARVMSEMHEQYFSDLNLDQD